MTKKLEELADRYGRKSDIVEIWKDIIEENYHVSAFMNPPCPVVLAEEQLQPLFWGMIPHWTKSPEDAEGIRKQTYNARAESLFKLPSFRESIKSRRCLVPSTGWFEWRHEKSGKIPYFIHVEEEEIFSMAGIYDSWTDCNTGEEIRTFSIVTTEANELMAFIHNTGKRMPALLDREQEKRWLDPGLSQEEIASLLHPFDPLQMDAYPVDPGFLKKSSYDPSIIRKVEVQPTLFGTSLC